MNDFSISMALVDYIPVVFFAIAAIILLRDLYDKMSKCAYALFSAGVIDVAIAGALKATWKLLCATGACNFEALDAKFFPVQSIGFLLAGIGILNMLLHKNSQKALMAAVPPVFSGTFLFVGLMVMGLGIMDVVLCILSAKLKKPWLIAIFAFFFHMLALYGISLQSGFCKIRYELDRRGSKCSWTGMLYGSGADAS